MDRYNFSCCSSRDLLLILLFVLVAVSNNQMHRHRVEKNTQAICFYKQVVKNRSSNSKLKPKKWIIQNFYVQHQILETYLLRQTICCCKTLKIIALRYVWKNTGFYNGFIFYIAFILVDFKWSGLRGIY